MKNKLAVIQSVYLIDNPEWLEESIVSIINQDYGFDRINYYLCIDGPMEDDLLEVIHKYESRFHKLVQNEKNLGLAKSLNKLIQCLEDEDFIFRMDSDDISLPERFRKQLEFLENNPETGICGASLIEVDKHGKHQRARNYFETNDQIVKNMYKGTAVGHPTVCFRRGALDLLKGYSESLKVSQDIEMWFRAIKAGIKFHNINESLLLFRKSDEFYSRRSIRKAFNEFRIYWNGCNDLYGFGWRNMFPLMRLLFRFVPFQMSQFIYNSKIRNYLFRT